MVSMSLVILCISGVVICKLGIDNNYYRPIEVHIHQWTGPTSLWKWFVAYYEPYSNSANRYCWFTLQQNIPVKYNNTRDAFSTDNVMNLCMYEVNSLRKYDLTVESFNGNPLWRNIMEGPHYWTLVRGIHRSPVNSPHKGPVTRALMFSLMLV